MKNLSTFFIIICLKIPNFPPLFMWLFLTPLIQNSREWRLRCVVYLPGALPECPAGGLFRVQVTLALSNAHCCLFSGREMKAQRGLCLMAVDLAFGSALLQDMCPVGRVEWTGCTL